MSILLIETHLYIFAHHVCFLSVSTNLYMSLRMRKPTICICENKDGDQIRGHREADQRLCFRHMDSAIPLLLKYKISSLLPSSVAIQSSLCWTWSESKLLVLSRTGSYTNTPFIEFSILFSTPSIQ